MGTVYRKTYTKPLPAEAETYKRQGEQFARWKDRKGKMRTAKFKTMEDGAQRIVLEAATYTAKFRDGSGIVREVATGCHSKDAAQSVLRDLASRAEKVRAGILSTTEDAIADHQASPLAEHIAACIASMESDGTTTAHRKTTKGYLLRLAADCSWSRLADLDRSALERWLVHKGSTGMSARSRNAYRTAAAAFAHWCVRTHRLIANPFVGVAKADERADPRRKRRALTEAEFRRLLNAARSRPLLEAMTIRRGKRKGERVAEVGDATRRRLERLGWERALVYKCLVLTGLRRNELASLKVGQLHLDGRFPHAVLEAADEKNRQGSQIPLRGDVVEDLRRDGSSIGLRLSERKPEPLEGQSRHTCRWIHRF